MRTTIIRDRCNPFHTETRIPSERYHVRFDDPLFDHSFQNSFHTKQEAEGWIESMLRLVPTLCGIMELNGSLPTFAR